MQYKRYTVTSALPYANGPIHIGHLAGVYVPADIYVRFLRSTDQDVVFIGGSDEHGVPITIKARQLGVTPQEIVDKYHAIIKQSFVEFGVSFDIYARTSNKIHHETADAFFRKLYYNGDFIEKLSMQYYDEENKQYLADRYITGTCPFCSNEKAYGDQCEKCGSTLNATDLINPRSAISGNAPVLKETRHWFLPLENYEAFLKEWILVGHKEDWKANVYGQCKSWLDQGLQPRAVTRDLDWGVKLPPEIEGTEGKVLYVWFDAPIGYISATKELTPDWEKYWKDKETKLVHFIGKDNIVFHCIIFPAMLKAEGTFILPDNVPANEFMNLEGDKISTSRNWAVWLHEYLIDFPGKQDELRYVLCANAPETKDNDFTWKDYQSKNNNELLAIFGNFVNRAMVLTHNYFGGIVPALGQINEADNATIQEIALFPARVAKSIEAYRFREAINEMMNLARLGNKYLTENEPWKVFKTDPNRVKTVLNISLQICANLSILCEPFLPFTADRLANMLNISLPKWKAAGSIALLSENHPLGQAAFLFQRIEDAAIEHQVQKLLDTKEANKAANVVINPAKSNIEYDDFSKMDIRTGTILAAEKVPKTKKLLKLTVDTGIDTRTIVSGIAEHYEAENIIGQKVSILVNLSPKNLKGIESQGMILMAENHDGKLCFVAPTEEIKNGSEVK